MSFTTHTNNDTAQIPVGRWNDQCRTMQNTEIELEAIQFMTSWDEPRHQEATGKSIAAASAQKY